MKYVIFENRGEIDTTALTTFGVSVKDTKNPIGFFGTGLKYAIAITLRENCDITAYSGLTKLDFALKSMNIRGADFDVVTMNQAPLAFTTELGKTWELIKAFRELYCNAMDEGGKVYLAEAIPPAEAGRTIIACSGTKFISCWDNRDSMILNSNPIYTSTELEIHPGPGKYLYYKGICTNTLHNLSRFTYNVLSPLKLTEDRTVNLYDAFEVVKRELVQCTERSVVQAIVSTMQGTLEYGFNFEYEKANENFLREVLLKVKTNAAGINSSLVRYLSRHRDISEVYESIRLTSVEKATLLLASKFLAKLGYEITYPIVVVETLGTNVLGAARNEKIYLTRQAFSMGTKVVAGTILEEYIHLRYDLYDESRAMQEFLLNALISQGEARFKRPL